MKRLQRIDSPFGGIRFSGREDVQISRIRRGDNFVLIERGVKKRGSRNEILIKKGKRKENLNNFPPKFIDMNLRKYEYEGK